ncbi:hypothetical protein WJX84_008439 [Apatococcus fuscideae]|uniref:HMG box domain-containing protein n=1 Tax=Apatococcus fuscideae TaxID=2026836 RepID=A0AAW1SQ82_9CHLO
MEEPFGTYPALQGYPAAPQRQASMVQAEEELIPLPMPMHMKRNRSRKKQDPTSGEPMKRVRSKKPVGAPTRPKSAYMFFLGEFREKWKLDNPESKKVAEVAKAAGEAWRAMPQEKKDGYEDLSTEAKSKYAKAMVEWEKEHPRPARRHKKERDPTQLKRPQSAYFFFLADYREAYKREHPGEPVAVKVIGKAAGDQWRDMSAEAREPYEQKSTENKKSYALLKTLTPQERCDYMLAVEHGQAPPITFEDMSMGGEGEDNEGQGQEERLQLPVPGALPGPAPAAPPLALPAPPQPGFDYPSGAPGSEVPHFSGAQLSAPIPLFIQPPGPLDSEAPPTSLQFNTALNEEYGHSDAGGQPSGEAALPLQPRSSPYHSFRPNDPAAGRHLGVHAQQAGFSTDRMTELD